MDYGSGDQTRAVRMAAG